MDIIVPFISSYWPTGLAAQGQLLNEHSNGRVHIYLLAYSMVQSLSWAANWFAASQEIPRISRNPKVHYRTHKLSPPVSILDQPNPVHLPTSYLLEIHPNIIHPSTPRSPQWSSPLRFPQQGPIHSPLLTHTRHMPSPSHSSRFYHPHNIGWGVISNDATCSFCWRMPCISVQGQQTALKLCGLWIKKLNLFHRRKHWTPLPSMYTLTYSVLHYLQCTHISKTTLFQIESHPVRLFRLRGAAVGWGNVLHAGRSRVRFLMVSLEFFIDIILPAVVWPWGWLSFWQKWVVGTFPGGKGGRRVGLTNLTTFKYRLPWNLGDWVSWKPLSLFRPLMGLLYPFTFTSFRLFLFSLLASVISFTCVTFLV
jgi:hypothetical protein